MLLGSVFERFAATSPISVMTRGLMETALNCPPLDALFNEQADEQYTRKLLSSSAVDLMSLVVCRARPRVRAAYRALADSLPVSLTSVYNKLDGLEPQVRAALVRHPVTRLGPVIRELGVQRQDWLPGYRVKILGGNHLAATGHRLAETRPMDFRPAARPVAGSPGPVSDAGHRCLSL